MVLQKGTTPGLSMKYCVCYPQYKFLVDGTWTASPCEPIAASGRWHCRMQHRRQGPCVQHKNGVNFKVKPIVDLYDP